MPGIARDGDQAVHDKDDKNVSAGTGTEASTTVIANGKGVHFLGNTWSNHTDEDDNVHNEDPPPPVIARGCSSTINVDGQPVAMINSTISCGAVINQGSEDVFVS
jgi:uncharacterized Zn-binding protein involved in type VI secretion